MQVENKSNDDGWMTRGCLRSDALPIRPASAPNASPARRGLASPGERYARRSDCLRKPVTAMRRPKEIARSAALRGCRAKRTALPAASPAPPSSRRDRLRFARALTPLANSADPRAGPSRSPLVEATRRYKLNAAGIEVAASLPFCGNAIHPSFCPSPVEETL